jgi:predicted metalloprotease with PDZ domain
MGTRSDPGEPTAPVVVRVTAGSPMARAGVALGDRLIAIDGVAIENQADMLARLAAAGDRVVIDVDRKGRIVRLEPTSKLD